MIAQSKINHNFQLIDKKNICNIDLILTKCYCSGNYKYYLKLNCPQIIKLNNCNSEYVAFKISKCLSIDGQVLQILDCVNICIKNRSVKKSELFIKKETSHTFIIINTNKRQIGKSKCFKNMDYSNTLCFESIKILIKPVYFDNSLLNKSIDFRSLL